MLEKGIGDKMILKTYVNLTDLQSSMKEQFSMGKCKGEKDDKPQRGEEEGDRFRQWGGWFKSQISR